jgi:Cu(I)/Ag(I) efflux system membrane protein CusA/SilA
MINRLIELSLKNRFIVLALYVGLAGWGWWALGATPIDAIPDLSDNQVIVFTDWPGHSPQEVEDQVSYPLTVNLQGLAGVRVVRSQSAFGFSMIYVVFDDKIDLYFARARVLERMSLVTKSLPAGVAPMLGPDATGVGHVFWYTVESPTLSLRDLRSLQDWFIRYQLNAVPGVAEVASVGGFVQQYQIDVDPNRLRTYNLPLSTVVAAVRESNLNVGGNVLDSNGAWLIVRGVGLIQSVDDVKQIVVGASGGVPIYVEQVADVHLGDAFRVAALVKGTKEAVGGVVVARSGVQHEAADRRGQGAYRADSTRPPGGRPARAVLRPVTVDRAGFRHSAECVNRRNPPGHAGARRLPDAFPIDPDCHHSATAGRAKRLPGDVLRRHFVQHHEPRRHRHRHRRPRRRRHRRHRERVPLPRAAAVDPRDRRVVWDTVLESHAAGRPPGVLFDGDHSAGVRPVFALTGQEGKLFHPLAFTKTFAVLAATVIAVTWSRSLHAAPWGQVSREEDNPSCDCCVGSIGRRSRRPVASRSDGARCRLLFAGALFVARGIGSEFMPPSTRAT